MSASGLGTSLQCGYLRKSSTSEKMERQEISSAIWRGLRAARCLQLTAPPLCYVPGLLLCSGSFRRGPSDAMRSRLALPAAAIRVAQVYLGPTQSGRAR